MSDSQASQIRKQLETLVVQNFKDAWDESLSSHLEELKEAGETTKDILAMDFSDAKEDFLRDYFWNLEALIRKESGLFNETN